MIVGIIKVFGHFMGGGSGAADDASGKGSKKGKGKAAGGGGKAGGGGRTRMAESTEDAAMLKGALQVRKMSNASVLFKQEGIEPL